MEPDIVRLVPFLEFFHHGSRAVASKLDPFQTGYLDEGETILTSHGPDDRLDHGEIRDIKGRDDDACLLRIFDDIIGVLHKHYPS